MYHTLTLFLFVFKFETDLILCKYIAKLHEVHLFEKIIYQEEGREDGRQEASFVETRVGK